MKVEKLVIYNPLEDKTPVGAIKYDKDITYQIKIGNVLCAQKVELVYYNESIENSVLLKPLHDKSTSFSCYTIYIAKLKDLKADVYFYYFKIYLKDRIMYVQKDKDNPSTCSTTEYVDNPFVQVVYANSLDTSSNLHNGIMYQIFVDRFCKTGTVHTKTTQVYREDWGGDLTANSSDPNIMNYEIFGGNLQGIVKKLPYLNKLGVNIIYLNPIFESFSNHKYDVSDYEHVDINFGKDIALKNLIAKAKEYNIQIILDGVFAHTGSNSIYFNKNYFYKSIGAFNSKDSKYYDWYKFTEYPNKYECWWGVPTLPKTNQYSKSFVDYITNSRTGILRHYMDKGILGFRLDVVDELTRSFTTKICSSIRSCKKNSLIIGEVWEDASTKVAYSEPKKYFLGDNINSVMNYPLRSSLIDYAMSGNSDSLRATICMILDQYPLYVQRNLMNIIGTHDTKRILSILLEKYNQTVAIDRLKLITALQYTFIGIPSIFYGDEVGLKGDIAPYCRKCFPWDDMDEELLNWFISLGKIRKHSVFKDGQLKLIYAENGIICYSRYTDKNTCFVIANMSDSDFTFNLDNKCKSLLSKVVYHSSITLSKGKFDIVMEQNNKSNIKQPKKDH